MATEPQTKTAKQRVPNQLFDLLYSAAPVVVARSESLQPLQALCHENDDVVPTLLTMRYRLRSGPVFGTVLATFALDLARRGRAVRRRARGHAPRARA